MLLCISLILENSHGQFIFTKLGVLGLNAAKTYCCESQSCVIPSWRVIATNKDSVGRCCADFVASSNSLSLFSKYVITYVNITLDLIFSEALLLPCQFNVIS